MKLERISYKNKIQGENSEVTPNIKVVIEKIDDIYYAVKKYHWNELTKQWHTSSSTSFFDGKKVHDNIGYVKARPLGDVDKHLEMLVKYKKFTVVSK